MSGEPPWARRAAPSCSIYHARQQLQNPSSADYAHGCCGSDTAHGEDGGGENTPCAIAKALLVPQEATGKLCGCIDDAGIDMSHTTRPSLLHLRRPDGRAERNFVWYMSTLAKIPFPHRWSHAPPHPLCNMNWAVSFAAGHVPGLSSASLPSRKGF